MKKIFVLLLLLCLVFSAFAAEAKSAGKTAGDVKSTGLTDSDVKSFCKNFNKIYKELDKLGASLNGKDGLVVSENALKKAESILNKNGVSGKNSVEKVKAIAYGYAIEYYEKELSKDKETAEMVKSLGIDPVAGIRSMVSAKDRGVVKKYVDDLYKVFNSEEFNSNLNDYASAVKDFDLGDYNAAGEEDIDYMSIMNKYLSEYGENSKVTDEEIETTKK